MKKAQLKRLTQSISKITDIMSPSEENVDAILEWVMPELDAGELASCLRYYYKYLSTAHEVDDKTVYDETYKAYFDPLPELFTRYTFIQKHMALTIKLGRRWWRYIQDYVKNPQYVIEKIGKKNPKIKTMLSTDLGQAYMAYYTERLHTFFSLYFWKFPRYHNHCGGLILYGLTDKQSNAWGFFCRKCHTPFCLEDIDNLTYQHRRNAVKK